MREEKRGYDTEEAERLNTALSGAREGRQEVWRMSDNQTHSYLPREVEGLVSKVLETPR